MCDNYRMGKQLLIAVVWVASLGIALFVGMQMGERLEPGGRAPGNQAGASEDRGSVLATTPRDSDGAQTERAGAKKRGSSGPARGRVEVIDDRPLTIEGLETVEELSAELMRYAKIKLHQGPEGQKELFKTINELLADKEMRRFVRDERQLMPLLYPWLRFAFDNDQQIIDMMETLYKEAAENPAYFEGMDDDPFEAFTEGLAVMLPGAVDAERLAKFTGYVEAILKLDPESLPKALKKNLSELRRNLEMWAGPISPEEMLAKLHDPDVSDDVKLGLLRRIPPDQLRGIDVAGIISLALARGNLSAVNSVRGVKLTASDYVVLDRAFMEGMGKTKNQWWQIRQYLQSTGRNKWEAMKPFIEEGLRRGGTLTNAFAQSLTWLSDRPSKEYVQGVIDGYALPDDVVKQLKQRYGLE